MPSWRTSISGHTKTLNSIMHISFIDPDDKEFKGTIKNARKKLETPMAPALPCKISKNSQNCELVVNPMKSNQNLREFWKTVNLQDCERENLYRIIMKTILQVKENLVHEFIPMPQAMKIPAAKAAVDKEWENWKRFRRGTWRKSEVRRRWSMKQGRRRKSSFRFADGHTSFKECWIGGKAPKM